MPATRKPARIAVTIGAVAVAAMILIALIGSRAAPAEEQKPKSPDLLQGSWAVTITEGPGTPDLPDWYKALVTFTPHGGAVATITDAGIKTGHGTWRQVGEREFAIVILLPQFDQAGGFLGTLKARATLKVHRKTFDSDDYRFEFFDPDGNPTGGAGVGGAHGERIKGSTVP